MLGLTEMFREVRFLTSPGHPTDFGRGARQQNIDGARGASVKRLDGFRRRENRQEFNGRQKCERNQYDVHHFVHPWRCGREVRSTDFLHVLEAAVGFTLVFELRSAQLLREDRAAPSVVDLGPKQSASSSL